MASGTFAGYRRATQANTFADGSTLPRSKGHRSSFRGCRPRELSGPPSCHKDPRGSTREGRSPRSRPSDIHMSLPIQAATRRRLRGPVVRSVRQERHQAAPSPVWPSRHTDDSDAQASFRSGIGLTSRITGPPHWIHHYQNARSAAPVHPFVRPYAGHRVGDVRVQCPPSYWCGRTFQPQR